MREQVVIFTNPKAGSGVWHQRVEPLYRLLEEAGFEAVLVDAPDRLDHLVQDQRPLRAVVVAGGDGTAELVANRTPPGTPLVLLPLGTENLLAKYLKLGPDPRQIVSIIESGESRQFDVGSVDGRLFLVMLSCGFDAEVVRRLHEGRRGNINHLSYAKPILDSIRNYEYPKLSVHCLVETDEHGSLREWIQIPAHWAFVFNVPTYAVGLQIAPDASPTDGQLDVATFSGGSFWHGLAHLSAVVLGKHPSRRRFRSCRTEQVRIESSGNVPYQLDGDPGGFLPVEVKLVPQRLTLLVPPTSVSDDQQRL